MREHPIVDLIDGLHQLGADVTCVEETDCPLVTIATKPLTGGRTSISRNMSSQFISSLLMASPAVDDTVTITIKNKLISTLYVSLFTGHMRQFEVDVEV